jgi:predicted small integral membrane protein
VTGVRAPWDIPVEDFFFGFALLTLVLALWERARTDIPRRGGA